MITDLEYELAILYRFYVESYERYVAESYGKPTGKDEIEYARLVRKAIHSIYPKPFNLSLAWMIPWQYVCLIASHSSLYPRISDMVNYRPEHPLNFDKYRVFRY